MYLKQYQKIFYIIASFGLVFWLAISFIGYTLFPQLQVITQSLTMVSEANCGCDQYATLLTNPNTYIAPLILLGIGALALIITLLKSTVIIIKTRVLIKQLSQQRIHTSHFRTTPIHVVEMNKPVALSVGFFRPQVFISTALQATLTPFELLAVLQHELHHVKQRDPLQRLILSLLQIVFPFQKKLFTHTLTLQELAADEAVRDSRALRQALSKMFTPQGIATTSAVALFAGVDARVDRLLGVAPRSITYATFILISGVVLGILTYSVEVTVAAPDYGLASCLQEQTMCIAEYEATQTMSEAPTMSID